MFLRSTNRKKDGKDHRYFSIVENRCLPGNRTVQRTVLYLGEINDQQQAAWRKTLEVFDEAEQRYTTMRLFPDDREIPADALDSVAVNCHTVQRVGWNLPVVREQAHCGVALFRFVEHLQRFAPCGLLLIVDFAQIQNRPLYGSIARQAAILHDTEVAMILAVLLPVCAAQEHRKQNDRLPAA